MKNIDRVLIATAAGAVIAAVALTGCAPKYVKKGRVVDVIEQNMVTRTHIRAVGIGAADPALATDTQRKATARNAAIVAAQYEMLTVVKGVEIEGGITVSRAMETDSALASRVKNIIRGAQIVSTRFTSDNGAVVVMELPKNRLRRLEGIKFK
ncbi:MAG: hypothetical protein ABIJ96_00720 [Elusimicrobiota bacterium]